MKAQPSAPADASVRPAVADRRETGQRRRIRASPFALLCMRPAAGTAAETNALFEIARTIDVGATRPNRQAIETDLLATRDGLAGSLMDREVIACFVTRGLASDGAGEVVAGSCKVGSTDSMAWHRAAERRTTRSGMRAEYDVLELERSGGHSIELSGNAVSPAARRTGIGRFQVQARLLFLHLHPPPGATHCYANLLAPEVDGEYPLYETVVRPLLGGITYDEADRLRYRTTAEIAALLTGGETAGPRLPCHLIPPQLRHLMGVAKPLVGSVQTALMLYGLRPDGRFDLLDFGPLLSASLRRIGRRLTPERLTAMKAADVRAGGRWRTLAPVRSTPREFACVRSLVRTRPGEGLVELDERTLAALDAEDGDPVHLMAERSRL